MALRRGPINPVHTQNLPFVYKKSIFFNARGALRLRKKIMLLTLEPDTASTVVGRRAPKMLSPPRRAFSLPLKRRNQRDCHY